MFIPSNLELILESALSFEEENKRGAFAVSLVMLLAGKVSLNEAAKFSGMSPSHFVFIIEKLQISKESFLNIEEQIACMEENTESWGDEPSKGKIKDENPKDIITDAFIVHGNEVQICTKDFRQFYAIKESLKESGGKYNAENQTWFLSDEQLTEWLNKEKEYGWFKA